MIRLTMAYQKKSGAATPVECQVEDRGDGSYELLWLSKTAGKFPIEVLIDGVHIGGSPTELTV